MIKIIKYSITLIIFFIISSLFILYFYLLEGIHFHNLKYKFINIEELYIKIDKKIIFKAKNIDINKKNKNNSNEINFKKQTKLIRDVLKYFSFFQEINLQNININHNKITFLSLHNNRFIFENKNISFNASLFPKRDKIFFKIYTLTLKQLKISLNNIEGSFYSDLRNLYITTNLIYNDTQLNTNLIVNNNSLNYDGTIRNISKQTFSQFQNSELNKIQNFSIYSIAFKGNDKKIVSKIEKIKITFDNIKISIPNINLNFNLYNQKIESYINKILINFKKYRIKMLNNNITYKIKFKNLKVNNEIIKIKDAKNNTLILSNNILNYEKFKIAKFSTKKSYLFSDIIKANIKNLELLYINNEIKIKIPILNINNKDLKSNIFNSQLNFDINKHKIFLENHNIEISYKKIKSIHIPIIESQYNISDNKFHSNIKIVKINNIKINDIKIQSNKNLINLIFNTHTLLSKQLTDILSNFDINIPIYQKGGTNIISGNINYNLNTSKITPKLNIEVNNSKLILSKNTFLNIQHSKLELKDSNISLKNTNLEFNKSIINLSYNIQKGLINLNKSYISTDGKFNDLNISNILEIKNYPEKLYIDLKGIDIFLKNLKTSILLHKNIIVKIQKLSKFYPYISYLKEYGIKDGNIKIDIGDEINIISKITDTNQTILENNLTPIKKIELKTTIKDNNITIYHPKLRLNILKEKNITIIKGGFKNLDLNITQFLDKNKSENNNSKSNKISVDIKAHKTNIIYKKMKLYSDKLAIKFNHSKFDNGKITSLYKDRNITILLQNGNIKLYGLNIKEKTLKDLTNSNILNNPILTIFAMYNKNSNITQGFIDIKQGYIKELKVFNNILAFINLIPSLVTFQPAGFNKKGYKVQNGHIEYIFYNKILYLKKVKIKGENLSFDGQGYINLNNNTIKLNVNVNLIVKLVKDIPILNYILLGKDGGITIRISVNGNLKDPKVSKNTASNIIEAPLGIIKRTLLTPFRPFMEDK